MKNETLARAITEIDDELIIDAHSHMSTNKTFRRYLCACAAVCLIFVCAIAIPLHRKSGPVVLMNGQIVSSQPVTVDLPAPRSSGTQQMVPAFITVPFEIVAEDRLSITAIDGTIEVYSSKTNEQICVGQFCETRGSVTVYWTIESPEYSQTYQVQVNHDEVVLLLKYEETINHWIITKMED